MEFFYRSIAISGEAGSGKSSVAQMLGEILEWETYGAGAEFRTSRKHLGIPGIGASHGTEGDHDDIDQNMARLMRRGKVITEGRVAVVVANVNHIPGVLKVLLVCEEEERNRRIYQRDPGKYPGGLIEVRQVTSERESDNQRTFAKRYAGLSYLDRSMYDMVLDTMINNLPQTGWAILNAMGVEQESQ